MGPIGPEIWLSRGAFKNKMLEVILLFGRAYLATIGGKTNQLISCPWPKSNLVACSLQKVYTYFSYDKNMLYGNIRLRMSQGVYAMFCYN